MNRFAGLDLLRVIAGLALIVCHTAFLLSSLRIPDSVWLYLGLVGVEIFLVSLGFLLTCRMLESAPVRIGRQWLRAIMRWWPLYLLMLALNLFISGAGVPGVPWMQYVVLAQNLAWPHPEFFGEAWIVAAAVMMALLIPLAVRFLARCSFAVGVRWIVCPLLVGCVVRSLVIGLQDPAFDLGVRKILLMRLDLPFYGVLAGWLWMHRRNELLRWRRAFAASGVIALAATAYVYVSVALDESVLARNALLPLCDLGCAMLLPWACSLRLGDRVGKVLRVVAASMYAGLLTHVTVLRLGVFLGLPLAAQSVLQGFLMLSACILVCGGVAILVWWLLDRPWLLLRDRLFAEHAGPVRER